MGNGKFQHFHFGQGSGNQGKFNFIIILVIAGENGSRTMKTDNFSLAVFMVCIVHFNAGNDVMDSVVGLSGFPEETALLKRLSDMGLRQEIVMELPEIIREEIAGSQHGFTSQFLENGRFAVVGLNCSISGTFLQ